MKGMKMKIRNTIITLTILVLSSNTVTLQEKQAFPEEAKKRLDYAIGKWRSKSEYLDKTGNVTKTVYSEDQRKYVIDGRVIEITGLVEESEQTFRAWEYYSIQEKKYTLTSIDKNGTLWTMKGDLGEKVRWTSESKNLADGRTVALRFTHYDLKEKSFTALGERSTHGGKTWVAFSRQFLTRISE
jgi:hypothetical protein